MLLGRGDRVQAVTLKGFCFRVKPHLARQHHRIFQIVTTSVDPGWWTRVRTLIVVIFVKEADISLWDDAQHACPSFS